MFNSEIKLFLIAILLFSLSSCGKNNEDDAIIKNTASGIVAKKEGFFGWETISLINSYTRLDVSPELGGKILGYEAAGLQILWHNPAHEGELEIFHQRDIGEEFINVGGAKVWPAPQDAWQGPPDKILDGSPYTYDFTDGVITVTSEKDIREGRTGLQYNHSYSLVRSSTLVNLDLSMTNVVNRTVEWGLWHLATVPAQTTATIYVPVDDGDWEVMHGEENPSQWLGIENGLFRAKYNGSIGKVGMKLREGWAVWHDETS